MKADYLEESLFRKLEERFLQSNVRKSAKDVIELIADEFIEFGSSGRVFDKQQIINSLQNEPIKPLTQRSITEFNVSRKSPPSLRDEDSEQCTHKVGIGSGG